MHPLSPERWREVEPVFDAVLDLDDGERRAYLRDLAERDPDLYRDLAALLEAEASAEALDDGIVGSAAAVAQQMIEDEGLVAGDVPEEVGAYRVLHPIGRGGMGEVYLAERVGAPFSRRVALKLLRTTGGDRAALERRFDHEQQLLARLEHDGIARLYDGGMMADGRPFFIMELVEGEPITAYCDARQLTLDARLRLFLRVIEAVRYAHLNLVVHCDLKPSNILVAEGADGAPHAGGRVKLLDFGIAKVLSEADPGMALTMTADGWLTPAYAAPEQIEGRPISTATDVYQLGVVLFELLTGHRPHEATTAFATQRAVCEEPARRPSAVVADDQQTSTPDVHAVAQARQTTTPALVRRLRGDLDAILLKALEKAPAERYSSAEALADDLSRFLENRPVRARQARPLHRAAKFVRRHRAGVATAAFVGALIVGFAALYGIRAAQERDAVAQATAVSGYLEDLFASADPYDPEAVPDTVFSARDLLLRGEVAAANLHERPVVQAGMLATIGEAYLNTGLLDRADSVLTRTYELRRLALGEDHALVAEAINDLGALRLEEGAYAEAEAHFRDALEIQQRHLGPRHPGVAETMSNLATVLSASDQTDAQEEAIRLFERALAIQREALGQASPTVATTLNNLAIFHYYRDELDQAEPLYREALRIDEAALGTDHPRVATTLNNLATLLRRQGASAEAAAALERSLAIKRTRLADDHPSIATSLNTLANVYRDMGHLEQAERTSREVLGMARGLYGAGSPRLINPTNGHALALLAQGRYDEAEPLFQEVARLLGALDPNHLFLGVTHYNLAMLSRDRGDLAAAEARLQDAFAILSQHDEPERLGSYHVGLGSVRVLQGRPAEGEAAIRTGLGLLEAAPNADDTLVADARARLGVALARQGQTDEARLHLTEALTVFQAAYPDAHPDVQRVQATLDRLP